MINSFFDNYALKARFLPAALIGLPYVITFYCWFSSTLSGEVLSVLTFILLMLVVPLSHFVRTRGKKMEFILFEKWGGVPTTQLLRHSNDYIGVEEKKRYRDILADKVSDVVMPSPNVEAQNPEQADKHYYSAIRWLISNTRDTQKYPLVFAENVNYGFRRNIYAVKYVAINALSVALMLNVVFLLWFSQSDTLGVPLLGYISLGLVVLMQICWAFFVHKKWVKETAYEYAKQLIQTCDSFAS